MNTIALGPYVPYWRPLAIAIVVIVAPILFSAFRQKDSYRAQWWIIFLIVIAAWTVAGEYRRAQADELEVVAAPTVSRGVVLRSPVDELTAAIRDRRRVAFRYDNVQRVVLPHRVGKSGTGNELLRAWELKRDGETVNAWRLYNLSKIETVYPIPGRPFEVAPEYKTPDKAIPEVYAEIK